MPAKTNTRVFSINDFLSWYDKGELDLSPKYQRKSYLWTLSTKSYFIDTLLRGMPIPPVYIRSITDVAARKTTREVIDGQQRLSTIFAFLNDEFTLSESIKDFGGKKYSDLGVEEKSDFLEKELAVEMVLTNNESEIADIFVRINSSNYPLNAQELRNAKYQNEFKILCNTLAEQYRAFFLENEIISKEECDRMQDAQLISQMLFILIEGDQKKMTEEDLNDLYKSFENNTKPLSFLQEKEEWLNLVMDKMQSIPEFNKMIKITGQSQYSAKNFIGFFYRCYISISKKEKQFDNNKFSTFLQKLTDVIILLKRASVKAHKIDISEAVDDVKFLPYYTKLFLKIGSSTEIMDKILKFSPDKLKKFDNIDDLLNEFLK